MRGYEDPHGPFSVYSWTVIPSLPGTRIEWEADWCECGSVPVHAWLVHLDIVGRKEKSVDTSCVVGRPMVLNAHGLLQDAELADMEGKPGEVIEP